MRSAILCNLFCHLDGNSIRSIITWASEGIWWITCHNYSIYVSPSSGEGLNIKRPCLMVTGILCPYDLVNCLVIHWTFWTNPPASGVICRLVPTNSLSIPVGYLTIAVRSYVEAQMTSYILLELILPSPVLFTNHMFLVQSWAYQQHEWLVSLRFPPFRFLGVSRLSEILSWYLMFLYSRRSQLHIF